ncbi:MAG: arginase family protein [Muribaculum sp.]|nr:arginase family protein [Muribaculum sp.]
MAGLRDTEYPYIAKRFDNLGITHFSPSDLSDTSSPVIEWLKSTGKSKVMFHFDMDVMDPNDILAAVAESPEGGMKLQEVSVSYQ